MNSFQMIVGWCVSRRLLLAPAAVCVIAGLAAAQGKPAPAGSGPMVIKPEKDWRKESEEMRTFQELRKGDLPVSRSNAPVLDHAAQWFAYRLTMPEYQEPGRSQGMTVLRKEALEPLWDLHDTKFPPTQQQAAFMSEYSKRFVARLHDVIKNPHLVARVNATMLLAAVAGKGYEEAADVLLEVIKDPAEKEAVKLWAFRGLHDLFLLGAGDNLDPFRDKEREARCVQTLIDYLASKPTLAADAPPDELEGLALVRAEAIAALGETRAPAYSHLVEKRREILRQTALTLLRIVAKEGMTPPPSLDEQVAAAIGVCRLQYRKCAEYQVDYAAQVLGRFLIEFIQRYNHEHEQNRYPWKAFALHLNQALILLKADVTGPPSSPHVTYVSKVVDPGERLLREILDGKSDPVPNDFAAWLDQNPPKSQSVYKDKADAVVRAGN
jgi:hypothetical protein